MKIIHHLRLIGLAALLMSAGSAFSAGAGPAKSPEKPVWLFAAEKPAAIQVLDQSGKVLWEYPVDMARDVWRLPNGNLLFPYNRNYDSARHDNPSGVLEVTTNKQVVFHYQTTGQVFSCQRLADGVTLVAAASQGKLLLVDAHTNLVKSISVKNRPGHSCMRYARGLANGNFLVAEESAQAVREYSAAGDMVREIKLDYPPFAAIRLDNGKTLISGKDSLAEVDASNAIIWRLRASDVPALGVRWFAGFQLLPNGNLFVCNAGGKVPFFEINREKQVIWQFTPNAASLGHGVQRLDLEGLPMK